MATKSTTSRPRSTATRTTTRKRRSTSGTTTARAAKAATPKTITDEAKTAVRSVRTRATRAAKKVPTDRTSVSIAIGVVAGLFAAGYAIFVNRGRIREAAATGSEAIKSAASTGSEKLKRAADDLSSIAHERIDQARDNITKFRARSNGVQPVADTESMAVGGISA